MDSAPAFFDVLPLRTSPKRLESLTSYLIRLAELNNIRSPQKFAPILGVNASDIQRIPDHLIRTLSEIAALASREPEQLLATTFTHLGWKFDGNMTQEARSLKMLLRKSLSSCLRYCPACLADEAYYPLIWRFLALQGCAVHGCRLLDHCGHCGNAIPLFPFPLKIGVCPLCKGSLCSCSAALLSEVEMQAARLHAADLEYLVSPLPSNGDGEAVKRVGYRLAQLRREKCLSTQQVADLTGMPWYEVIRVEQGGIHQCSSVQGYMSYVGYFGVSLRDIFEECAAREVVVEETHAQRDSHQDAQSFWQLHESLVLEHVGEVIHSLHMRGERATAYTVARDMRMPAKAFRQYATVDAFWQKVEADVREERDTERQLRERELLDQVESAACTLKNDGRELTQGAISQMVGITVGGLCYYPQVRALLAAYCPVQKNQLGEDLVVEQTLAALAYLRSSGQHVSQTAISRLTGFSMTQLKACPKVSPVLEQAKQEFYVRRKMRKQPAPEDKSSQF